MASFPMRARNSARLLALATLTGSVLAAGIVTAYADDTDVSPQTRRLCDGADVACSVQVDPVVTEGETTEVVVTGKPMTDVDVRAFRAELSASGEITRLRPYGPVARISTDSHGFGSADLRLPDLAVGDVGGPVLFALDDSTLRTVSDLTAVLGTWSTLASRRPLVLGDGFGTSKPVGVTITLQVTSAVPGTRFAVELDDGDDWRQISTGDATCGDAAAACTISYEIPRGLADHQHLVRLANQATGAPVALWKVRPSDTGTPRDPARIPTLPPVGTDVTGSINGATGGMSNAVPRPRAQSLDMPDIASKVPGATGLAEHHPATVRRVAGALAALALALSVLGLARGEQRRRRALRAVADRRGGHR